MPSPKSTQDTGRRGEALAAAYLLENGYVILTRNWRSPKGELDIVAKQGETLVFVEVRTRHSLTTETAFASILPAKRTHIVSAVHGYLQQHQLESAPWRVDVVAVALPYRASPIIDHVEDALGW
ncbi:MAG: YraN family protein [bacterium]|nr:YraN family protein [bacterium]